MTTRIIVSYDGTDSDRDALALGRLLAGAGATLELAYVRHAHEAQSGREHLAEHEAETLLQAGANAIGQPELPQHVVVSGSTPEGLRDLALASGSDLILFGSEYRTAPGHVDPQASARQLLDGGPIAVGLAPAGLAERGDISIETIAAVSEDGDPCTVETAASLARRLGGAVAEQPSREADLIVVGSKPGTVTGRVTVSAAAEYLIELASCPILVLPRGIALAFNGGGD